MEHNETTYYSRYEEVLDMIYDAEEIYDAGMVESYLDDDEIDCAEAGFMRGYLGHWRGF